MRKVGRLALRRRLRRRRRAGIIGSRVRLASLLQRCQGVVVKRSAGRPLHLRLKRLDGASRGGAQCAVLRHPRADNLGKAGLRPGDYLRVLFRRIKSESAL